MTNPTIICPSKMEYVIALILDSTLLSNLSARSGFSLANLGSCPQDRMSSRSVSLLGSSPSLTLSKTADGPGFIKGALHKRDTY